jgi:hypothetical protein
MKIEGKKPGIGNPLNPHRVGTGRPIKRLILPSPNKIRARFLNCWNFLRALTTTYIGETWYNT